MNLVQRVQDILLKPKDTWPVIATEPGDAASLYKDYLIYMALVPAVAGFIGSPMTNLLTSSAAISSALSCKWAGTIMRVRAMQV